MNIMLFSCFLKKSYFPGSGTGAENGAVVENTGIMTEAVGRDSLHPDMTWVPSRNEWEETGEMSSNIHPQCVEQCLLVLMVFDLYLCRDDHGGDPYRGGYDLAYGGGGGPSYGPPQHWGHPDLHLMQPHHGIPIQARWETLLTFQQMLLPLLMLVSECYCDLFHERNTWQESHFH